MGSDISEVKIETLPDEILETVFQFIPTVELTTVCSLVCRRWRRVSERQAVALRRRADLRRLHRSTRAVLLTAAHVDLLDTIGDIATQVRHLRELTAHAHVPFHRTHVEALQNLPHLTHLDIFTRPQLLDERLAPVSRLLHTFVVNESVAPGLLRPLAASSCLVALHMFGRAVHYPRRELLAVLRARAPHLRHLTLRCTELPGAAYELIGDCTNLRSLQLYSCWLLTAATARAVCRPRGLRRLHVTGAKLVRRQALADMLADLPEGLHELVLSSGWFGDEHVDVVARRVPDLRVIELWRCQLTEHGALALAAALPRLEQLDLDLTLTKNHLQTMAHHPCLRLVRCIPQSAGQDSDDLHMKEHPTWVVDGLRVLATDAPYAHKYFRPGGEGFRSALFYFWTQDVTLDAKGASIVR